MKEWRREARQVIGYRKGKVMSWGRKAVSAYTLLRTNKGALRAWKFKIGKDDSPSAGTAGRGMRPGTIWFLCARSGRSCGSVVWRRGYFKKLAQLGRSR